MYSLSNCSTTMALASRKELRLAGPFLAGKDRSSARRTLRSREHHGLFHHVLQFSDVPRPGVQQQFLNGIRCKVGGWIAVPGCKFVQEVASQCRDILSSLAQGRESQGNHAQPLIQIPAKGLFFDRPLPDQYCWRQRPGHPPSPLWQHPARGTLYPGESATVWSAPAEEGNRFHPERGFRPRPHG